VTRIFAFFIDNLALLEMSRLRKLNFDLLGPWESIFLLIFHVASDGRSGNGRNRSETCSKGARISRELNNMTHQDA
jgi:hypothetical protein